MGTFDALETWRAALDAAGVRATNDSRAQFSSPAGYVLIPRPTLAIPALAGSAGAHLLSGSLWLVCDGPEGTAAWLALDALLAIAAPIVGEHLAQVNMAPEVYTLAAMGLDQPAIELVYADVPVLLY